MAMGTPTAEQIKRADAALQRKRAARAAAEAQAEKDALADAQEPEDHTKPGAQVPLHILNARSRAEDRAIRALNSEAAKAAAVAVNTVLAGKNRPKPKVAAKASPKAPDAANPAPEGPQKPPKGSTSTRPIPSGGTKSTKN